MNDFLPDNYEIPKQPSNYMRLEEGSNVFRILSSAITGYEYWNTQNKPVRSATPWEDIPADIKLDLQGQIKIKHFWAFVVWNYAEKRVQILELTQPSIQKAIKVLVNNPKWGDPKKYDIAVNRIDENITTYNVQAEPPISEPADDILENYAKKRINLKALYTGKDPFDSIS